jgi:hypothetical protein
MGPEYNILSLMCLSFFLSEPIRVTNRMSIVTLYAVRFFEHIHTIKTVNLKFFRSTKNHVRHIWSCLGFIQRLLKDHMFILALNICFKAGLLQTTSHPNI